MTSNKYTSRYKLVAGRLANCTYIHYHREANVFTAALYKTANTNAVGTPPPTNHLVKINRLHCLLAQANQSFTLLTASLIKDASPHLR
jgi:hypothetical protein